MAAKRWIALAFFLGVPGIAYGYLDAGSGSYILQVALALFLGAGFAFRSYLRKILDSIAGVFGKKSKRDDVSGTNR